MEEINNHNLNTAESEDLSSPDFSKISEKPKKKKFSRFLYIAFKILVIFLIFSIILLGIIGLIYYKNIKQAYNLAFSAKDNIELAIHKSVNREFKEAASLIKQSNTELEQTKELLDGVIFVRHVPYISTQIKAVDNLLEAGIELTDSGEKVVLLVDDIVAPLANESITYASITPEQKKDILNKIVESESLLIEVQGQIDRAVELIDAIPEDKVVKQLRNSIIPIKDDLHTGKNIIDRSLPMIGVIPKIVGFDQPRNYLFLLQNNNELRPTGGFIGTYGILKLANGELVQFDTDNIYNLDRAPQYIMQEPAPEPIVKYLDQPYWSLRDINWSPDFPTTAQKALEMYHKEYGIYQSLKESGNVVVGERDIEITELIPYEENIDGVIAMTPELMGEFLKLTGPVAVNGRLFTADNFQDEIEYIVGREFLELDIPFSERKGIIKQLADQVILKTMSLPFHKVKDVIGIGFNSLDQKQVILYMSDPQLQELVLDRGWGGSLKNTEGDYLMVVDSNLASLKTDQFIDRSIDYTVTQQAGDIVAKVDITYQHNGNFDWRTSRLRTYTRIYVPLGSQLIKTTGNMENDKTKDPEGKPGKVEIGQEFNKTFFGAFISIEPQETGILSFEYKLPVEFVSEIEKGNYTLLIQKQPGVIPNLTLGLKFDKTIKSALPPELKTEWFNKDFNYTTPLNQDQQFYINF